MQSFEWWEKLLHALVAMWPLHHLLRMTDFDKPIIGFVHPYIRDLFSHLQSLEVDEEGNQRQMQSTMYRIASDRLGNWCGDIHMAAYFLNAYFFEEVYNSVENSAAILGRAMKMVWYNLSNVERDRKIMSAMDEWACYKTKTGPLHGADMNYAWKLAARNERSPAQWWRVYGSAAPHLMEFAIAVLSQFVTAAASERGWQRATR